MNERQAYLEAILYGGTPFVYPGEGKKETIPRADDPDFMGQTLDILELESARAAMKLAENMMAWSRTPAAGKLRMLVVQYVIFGEPSVDEIRYPMKVSRSRVFQVAREVRGHCAPLLKLHRGKAL
jgi:hypothetical protein